MEDKASENRVEAVVTLHLISHRQAERQKTCAKSRRSRRIRLRSNQYLVSAKLCKELADNFTPRVFNVTLKNVEMVIHHYAC